MNQDKTMSVKEAAAYLGLRPITIYKLKAARVLSYTQYSGPHGRVVFSKATLDNYRKQFTVKGMF